MPGEEKVCALTSRSYASQSPRFYQTVLGDQGENDPIVPRAESDQIVNAVRKNGVPVWYLVMSGEGHGISRARRWHAPCAPRGLMDVAHHLAQNPDFAVVALPQIFRLCAPPLASGVGQAAPP
ncbi:MAG: prolyl oligopeptidase family serine peptidase [Acidobacteria bacterium]|nr:prolyl oligopeptidase family serine peptidase [Acidobacteriota bacterium]